MQKMNFTFHVIVLLMITLVFNMPSIAFAQQNIDEVQIATADAKRDARKDVNILLWATLGCMSYAGAGAVTYTTYSVLPPGTGWLELDRTLISLATGLLVPTVLTTSIQSLEPVIPIKRLMGKSPQYITAYTKTYQEQVKKRRRSTIATGFITGCMIMCGIGLTVGG